METEAQWLCSGCEGLLYPFRKCSFGGLGRLRVRSRIVLMRERTGGGPRHQSALLLWLLFSGCGDSGFLVLVIDVHRRSDMSPGAAQAERRIACRTFRRLLGY